MVLWLPPAAWQAWSWLMVSRRACLRTTGRLTGTGWWLSDRRPPATSSVLCVRVGFCTVALGSWERCCSVGHHSDSILLRPHGTRSRGVRSASWAAGCVAACRVDVPKAQAIAALSVWGAERLHGHTNVRQVYMHGHLTALGSLAPPCSHDDGHKRLDALEDVARLPLNIDLPEHRTRVPPVTRNHGRHFHSAEGADFEQGDPCCLSILFPRRQCCAAGSRASPAGP